MPHDNHRQTFALKWLNNIADMSKAPGNGEMRISQELSEVATQVSLKTKDFSYADMKES